jgi:DNA-binding transcriptional MerR regulator
MTDTTMSQPPTPSTYTIDELARVAETTVRNIRAYQERGILPPPVRHGRVGIYSDSHVAQLRIIAQLLGRGFSIANISELFQTHANGQGLNHLIGIDTALTSRWIEQLPSLHQLDDLINMLPTAPTVEEITRIFNMGFIRSAQHDLVQLRSPLLIKLAIRFMEQGFTLSELLDIIDTINPSFNHIAESLANVAVRVALGLTPHQPLESQPQHTEDRIRLIWSLRPMVAEMVQQEIAQALSKALQRQMTEQLVATLTNPPSS